jgi:hypothetical protein
MRFRFLITVAMLAACGPRLPPPNSADARYGGQQRAVQARVCSLQPRPAWRWWRLIGPLSRRRHRTRERAPRPLQPAAPPSASGSAALASLLQRLRFGAGRRRSCWTADAGRNQRSVCGLGPDPSPPDYATNWSRYHVEVLAARSLQPTPILTATCRLPILSQDTCFIS